MEFGPDRAPGALVLTFDNLGEASELQRGAWPAADPLGRHPSVIVALPWLLSELGRRRLTATFFVEAINCELYPDAVREIAERGHELGMHGWRHEPWASVAPAEERALLARGVDAFAALGLRPTGFRPPGGELTVASAALLRGAGFTWCSPAGGAFGEHDGLSWLPFEWDLVDAYHLMERFGALLPPDVLAGRLRAAVSRPGARTLVLHPFLMLDEVWRAHVGDLLAVIAAVAADGRTWVIPGERFAAT